MDLRLSGARALNAEGIIPVGPHERAPDQAPSVTQLGFATTTLTSFSTNSDIGPIKFSLGVVDQLAVTAPSYPVARYGQARRTLCYRLRHSARIL